MRDKKLAGSIAGITKVNKVLVADCHYIFAYIRMGCICY